MRREPAKPNHLLRYRLVDGIAVLTLNNSGRRNALSTEMLSALKEHLERIKDDSAVRVVVLRAEGPVFSSGHDLRELHAAGDKDNARIFALCTEVMEAIRLLPQPVIAQVHGLATAAGCQLVASCDIAIASEEATFATPGVKIGLFCTTPGVALVRAVPPKKAMEMLLTGMPISAREALQHGLVSRVVPAEELEERCMELAHQVATASSHVVAIGKRAFYQQLELDRPAAYEVAQRVMLQNLQSYDAKEGIEAFLDKREPKWKDI
ncbi:MAG: enoyl-CoA hydratase [Chloroflexi bacterium]|nr:enoyl-CoA hydratase [Chloroflexota bacterium]